MFRQLLTIGAMVLLVASCSTTQDSNTPAPVTGQNIDSNDYGASGGERNNYSSRSTLDSQDIEPFSPIPGSEVGARQADRVFFDFDSALLTSQAQQTLDIQADWLRDHPDIDVSIEGHCDERGTREYNLALGERRAMAVKKYLVNAGVNPRRLSTVSYGKERPVVLADGEYGHSQNRRSVTVLERY